MKKLPVKLAILVFALSYLPQAFAQEGDWYVAPMVTYYDDDGDRNIDDSLAGGQITVGRQMTDHLAFEGLLSYLDISGYRDINVFSLGQKHLELSANMLAFPNRDWTFAPYFLVGVGYVSADIESARGRIFENGSQEDGASATAGLGFNWKMGDSRVSIRGEYRARLVFGSDENLTDNLASIGVQFSFGKKPLPADDNADTDGDGVLDLWDECPNTPRGEQVSSRGCPLLDLNRDADGDRVPDSSDRCPNTPTGIAVDPFGCPLDSDGDGVTTGQDRCPASRPGAVVDRYGCERDDDKDGVQNHLDDCPNTRAGVQVDVNGCEIEDIIQLQGVNFESGADRLLPGTESLLGDIAATLKKHPSMRVEVAGHTDSVGLADSNYGLSERRANTVRDYLINLGVGANRLTAMGYGESQPIAGNHSAEDRATNRRVELRIISR